MTTTGSTGRSRRGTGRRTGSGATICRDGLDRQITARESSPSTIADVNYTYDPAGNLTKVADTPQGGVAETQCFTYDYVRRLTEAWTPWGGDCAVAPSAGALGGPAPYWQSYTYSTVGERTASTDHATPTGDVTTTYTYPAPGAAQPHTLRGTSTTDNTGTRTGSYALGDTTSRPGPHGNETLTWDAEGHLATVTDTAGTTTYTYDADGNRLLARDPAGTTLYLPGSELRLTKATGLVSCTRYYSHGGMVVAQRTTAGVTWLTPDWQGTDQVAIDAGGTQVTQRRQTPFGGPRGVQVTWPNPRGFVGGTNDPTGLTHEGAREYDPGTGRFVSVDPVFDSGDRQQTEAGVAAGIVAGAVCEAATAGAGSVGCLALAGAVSNMVEYTVETKVEHKGSFSRGGLLVQGAVGAATGAVLGVGGKVLGAGIKAGVKTAVGSAIARQAAKSAANTVTRASTIQMLARTAMLGMVSRGGGRAAGGVSRRAQRAAARALRSAVRAGPSKEGAGTGWSQPAEGAYPRAGAGSEYPGEYVGAAGKPIDEVHPTIESQGSGQEDT